VLARVGRFLCLVASYVANVAKHAVNHCVWVSLWEGVEIRQLLQAAVCLTSALQK
jgi:hypothetical protein